MWDKPIRTIYVLVAIYSYPASSYNDMCQYAAPCVPLGDSNICLGSKVKYTHTSLDLVSSFSTLQQQLENLTVWKSLQSVPRCWDMINPLLCAIYMPKCENSSVEMFRRDLCTKAKESCSIVTELIEGGWPSFLQCDQPYFSTGETCTAETYTKTVYRDNVSCSYPLTKTTNEASYYIGIDGCGILCEDPMYTEEQHKSMYIFIGVVGFCCLFATLIAALTFVIDWKNSSKYPSVIIFYMNICFFLGSIGWLAQYAGANSKSDIVCRGDGTIRLDEPVTGEENETAACTVVFFIVYYTMMAAVTWFVILSYSWHVKFRKLQSGSVDDKLKGKIAYFHIAAWALPLVFAIIALALRKVDGDFLTGICFISNSDRYATTFLVLLPVAASFCIGICFLVEGVIRLYKLRKTGDSVRNDKATSKITATMIRLGVFSVLATVFVIVTLSAHIYDYTQADLWEMSFRSYTLCLIRTRFASEETECHISDRANLLLTYLSIFSYFGSGILMSSWTWTTASKDTWKRFLRKVFRLPTNKPVKLKSRHKIIAMAFQRKQQKKTGRKISLDFHTSHDDPLGMKMDAGSVTSQDLSSAWMEAMPKLVTRRGGVALPVAGTLRRYSDSDISSMIASRRASLDSQLSEAEKSVKVRSRKRGGGRKRSRGINSADIAAFNAKRRGSNVSQKSKDNFRAHFSRRISNASGSMASDASAHNISFECEESSYNVGNSKRSSIDSSTVHAGLTNTAQLEQLTLATYSMFTANARPPSQTSRSKSGLKSRPSANQSTGSSRCTSGKSRPLQTPSSGYINGALDMDNTDDLSDISMS